MARPKKKKKEELSIAGVVGKLKARYPGKIYTAQEYTMPWMLKRLPSGLLDLDIALSGGLPAGGMSFFIGREGVGKNWLANQVIREQQILYGEDTGIAVISTEMVYDKMFAKACGVRVALSDREINELARQYEAETGEQLSDEEVTDLQDQVGTFITVPPATVEESFDIALDIIASREFDIVLIDSFGSLLTELDEEKSFQDAPRVGGAAAVNTRFARKINHALAPDENGDPNLTCVIGINQVRDNMNRANKYSPMTQESGGWALKHARWLTIDLSPAGRIKDGKTQVGKTIRWSITKQKAGGHEGASGTYDFLYGLTGVDRAAQSVAVAADYDVVQRAGAWFSYDGERMGQGLKKAAEYVLSQGLLEDIEKRTLVAANVRRTY